MIIGIDGRNAEGDLVGIGNYIKNLTEGFVRKGFSVVIFYSRKPRYKIKGVKHVVIKSRNKYLFEQISLPRALKENSIDIYHGTGNLGLPVITSVPAVLTIHDLIPLDFENYFKNARLPFLSESIFRLNTLISCYKARKIITISKFVKGEVGDTFNISSDKISVIYSGVRIGKFGKLPVKLAGEKYILNHGGIDIRKNIEGLIQSFVEINKNFPDYKLVITGENPELRSKLDRLIKKCRLNESIFFVGYVSDEVLYALIKNAQCICYPSLMEGFGMPIVEGFALGVPVICSNVTSMPEIAENAAILINPNNYDEIAKAVISVIKNKKRTNVMVKKAKKIVKKYDWELTIEKTIKTYNEVLK